MKNIFLAKSPLQLINALEARHYFKLEDRDCILIIMGDSKSYPQMMELARSQNEWNNIILLNRVSLMFFDPWRLESINYEDSDKLRKTVFRSAFYNIWRLNRLARSVGDVENVFMGCNNSIYMRHFVNSFKHANTILLDDGTGTIDIARKRRVAGKRRAGVDSEVPVKLYKKIKINLKRFLLRLKDYQPDKVCFFTVYDIDVYGEDTLIENNFKYLRGKSLNSDVLDEVYFVGSPLSETGVMSEDDYIDHLIKVKDYFKGSKLVYIVHRRESKKKLGIIRENLGITVKMFDYPLEYQIAVIGSKPKVLAAFVTSVLENMRVIMGDDLMMISFKLIKGAYINKDGVDEVYEYYEKNMSDNFKLVELT